MKAESRFKFSQKINIPNIDLITDDKPMIVTSSLHEICKKGKKKKKKIRTEKIQRN
jgi:hypothetical protein